MARNCIKLLSLDTCQQKSEWNFTESVLYFFFFFFFFQFWSMLVSSFMFIFNKLIILIYFYLFKAVTRMFL